MSVDALCPDGGAQWQESRRHCHGPAFDIPVIPGGYAWWYIDAISDCGQYTLTVIAFVGSVFSPWYRKARDAGTSDPLAHCAINVALHGPHGNIWVFTERPRQAHHRTASQLDLGGGTKMRWQDGQLVVTLDEQTKPFFERMVPQLRGELRLEPGTLHGQPLALDAQGLHRWWCIAPHARLEVTLVQPEVRFSANAYHDANHGLVPLESSFGGWNWCRGSVRAGTAVTYDTVDSAGHLRRLGIVFGRDGSRHAFRPENEVDLGRATWGIDRGVRSEGNARVLRTLEASPFYARSLVQLHWLGQTTTGIHETLNLQRFSAPWVRFLLPWRIRRERVNAATPALEEAAHVA